MKTLVIFWGVYLTTTGGINGGSALTPEEFGMDMTTRAYDAVCWWEFLKDFPNRNNTLHKKCSGQGGQVKWNIDSQGDDFQKDTKNVRYYYGKWFKDMALNDNKLPSDYSDKCASYLDKPEDSPPSGVDESYALNDGNQKYPFKAFAHCLVHTLRERHGDTAIGDMADEMTHTRKHWAMILLDRGNELRALHGVKPLKLNKQLSDDAQKYADKIAASCKSKHSSKEESLYNGETTGENLASGSAENNFEGAYSTAGSWYDEIQNYPWDEGYHGQSTPGAIGHFTQTVWKGSKYAGYGYAFNLECKKKGKYGQYFVARYHPAGNMQGAYDENVKPLKS